MKLAVVEERREGEEKKGKGKEKEKGKGKIQPGDSSKTTGEKSKLKLKFTEKGVELASKKKKRSRSTSTLPIIPPPEKKQKSAVPKVPISRKEKINVTSLSPTPEGDAPDWDQVEQSPRTDQATGVEREVGLDQEAGSPLPAPRVLDVREIKDLLDQLELAIPDSEAHTGVVWKENFLPGYPDSLGVFLPGYSEVQAGNQDPEVQSRYAREVFRATASSSQNTSLEADSRAVINKLITSLHEMGVVFGHFKDHLDKEGLGMEFINSDKVITKKALADNKFLRQMVDQQLKLRVQQEKQVEQMSSELQSLRVSHDNLLGQLEVSNIDLIDAKTEMGRAQVDAIEKGAELDEVKAKIVRLREDNEATLREAKAEIARLKEDKEKAEQKGVSHFLESEAFTRAVQHASLDLTQHLVYTELEKLSTVYPFTPEELGFNRIPDHDAQIKILPGYTWDKKNDHLLKPDGSACEEVARVESRDPLTLEFKWREYMQWPLDLSSASSEEEEDDASEDLSNPPQE